MALPGFDALVTVATGASATYASLNGIRGFQISDSRDLLDITDMMDGNVRARLAGLRDVSLSLSGDLEPADTGLAHMRSSYNTGVACTFQVLTHATSAQFTATSGFAFTMQLESIDINGSVDGKVEVSISAMIDASAGSAIFVL